MKRKFEGTEEQFVKKKKKYIKETEKEIYECQVKGITNFEKKFFQLKDFANKKILLYCYRENFSEETINDLNVLSQMSSTLDNMGYNICTLTTERY
jgi:hypothetical protein